METVVKEETLERRLRLALEQNQFRLHYQPQVERCGGRIVAAEALLRWQDPQGGLRAPGYFLGALESTGLIVPVGEWVLEQATEDCQRWQRLGFPRLQIGINVSTLQLKKRGRDAGAFGTSALRSLCDVQLEIAANEMSAAPESILRTLHALRYEGVNVAVQEFGSNEIVGERLWALPVDVVKIGRSLIQRLTLDAKAELEVFSIITQARAYRLGVVAEGVETREQLERLAGLHCPRTQGFVHSAPVSAPAFEAMMMGFSTVGVVRPLARPAFN
ncbi:MAG: EAL domain-containing protein [Gammaproteobacteria bacterium]